MIRKSIGAYADEIIAELGYNSSDKKIDRRNVIVRLDEERTKLMNSLVYYGRYIGTGYVYQIDKNAVNLPPVYYVAKVIPVQFDCDQERYYSDFGERVSFNNTTGIRSITATKDYTDVFVNQELGAAGGFGLLESAALAGQKGYELEGMTKIWYNNMPDGFEKVRITYIPTLTSMNETDLIPMSGELAGIMMDNTRQAFGIQLQISEDKTTDSVSNNGA